MDLESISNLRPYVGKANVDALVCINNSCGLVATTVKLKPGFDWARTLVCDVCGVQWYVCTRCARSRSRFEKNFQLVHHERRSHHEKDKIKAAMKLLNQKKQEETRASELDSDGATESEGGGDAPAHEDPPEPQEPAKAIIKLEHVGKQSERFFNDDLGGRGVYKLVARSQFHIDNLDEDLELDDVKMLVGLCRLANELSRTQRDRLAVLLDLVVNHTKKSCDPNKMATTLETKVPSTPSQVREMFIKGSHAMVPNLPRPTVRLLGDHAYVSLKECIQDVLARDVVLEPICSGMPNPIVSKLSECKAAKPIWEAAYELYGDKLLYGNAMCLYITEWSDDFEPNSLQKSGRGSIWIKTITISSPTAGRQTIANTYPIAVGPKSSSHEKVETRFMEELVEIQKGDFSCYVKSQANVIPIYAAVIASLQDQPERRGCNYIMAGNGTYTSRWRYSADLNQLESRVPSCDSCLAKLQDGEDFLSCDLCTNWSLDSESPLLDTEPPKNYPPEMLPQSGKLRPKKIEYKNLVEAADKALSKLVAGDWSAKQATAYLAAEGPNHELINDVIDVADRIANYKYLESNKEQFPQEYDVISKHRKERPDLYEGWKPPSPWRRGTSMDQRIDAIMHLLFLGLMKTVMLTTKDWLTDLGKFASFVRFAGGVMESVQQLNLSWCKAIAFKNGKLGGWVSENYLAMARISKWFYGRVEDLHTEYVDVDLTLQGINKWTKKLCVQWLRVRRQPMKGNAEEVKERVESLLRDPKGPPPVADLPTFGDVQQVHHAFVAVVSRIMTDTVSIADVESVSLRIKIFLTLYDRLEQKLYPGRPSPGWVSSYNFSSLLNTPDSMTQYGPLRNLWEGGYQGEGILRYVKQEANHGMRKNWQCRLVERVLETKSIEYMEASLGGLTAKVESGDDDAGYKTYKNEVAAMADFGNCRPLSGVMLNDGTIGMVLHGGFLMVLTQVNATPTELNGCIYTTWAATTDNGDNGGITTRSDWNSADIKMYLLFLPFLDITGKPDPAKPHQYYVVNEEWKERHGDGSFHYPDFIKP